MIGKPSAFTERVHHAKYCLLLGRTDSKAFDMCFEMKDGPLVILRLLKMAESRTELSKAIEGLNLGSTFLFCYPDYLNGGSPQ